MKYGFGVDLGGTSVKLAYFDQTGTLLDKWEIPTVTENSGERILPDIAASIDSYLREHRIPAASILGIGIGVPGPVSTKGIVNCCVNLCIQGPLSFRRSRLRMSFLRFPQPVQRMQSVGGRMVWLWKVSKVC